MKIGYARKSTHLQDVAHQVDELTKAGCEQIYQDQTSRSGPKRDKKGHCCKVSDEAAFCLIQRPYISKTLLTRRISPRGSP
ncbi:recombinase family protein [Klebsiella pneumoniae]|uniref:recombinase family protein n=1 Tax=Klebsiella pneumoniae TaxID=573 RepID=UPI0021B0A706|nr:recombinase family protein [Klebsiella pneumoniae]